MSKWEVIVFDHLNNKTAYKGIIESENLLEAERQVKENYPQKNQRYSYKIKLSLIKKTR